MQMKRKRPFLPQPHLILLVIGLNFLEKNNIKSWIEVEKNKNGELKKTVIKKLRNNNY